MVEQIDIHGIVDGSAGHGRGYDQTSAVIAHYAVGPGSDPPPPGRGTQPTHPLVHPLAAQRASASVPETCHLGGVVLVLAVVLPFLLVVSEVLPQIHRVLRRVSSQNLHGSPFRV